jgi:hypothetical protein
MLEMLAMLVGIFYTNLPEVVNILPGVVEFGTI